MRENEIEKNIEGNQPEKERSIDVEDTDDEAQQTRRYPLRARKTKRVSEYCNISSNLWRF